MEGNERGNVEGVEGGIGKKDEVSVLIESNPDCNEGEK